MEMRAPPKCKFYFLLAQYERCWTSERLFRHGLRDENKCALCDQELETVDHLLLGCVFSQECWFKLLRFSGSQGLTPTQEEKLIDWWLQSRKRIARALKKGFDSMVVLTARTIWKSVRQPEKITACHRQRHSGGVAYVGESR